jgi:hypothetical protein
MSLNRHFYPYHQTEAIHIFMTKWKYINSPVQFTAKTLSSIQNEFLEMSAA